MAFKGKPTAPKKRSAFPLPMHAFTHSLQETLHAGFGLRDYTDLQTEGRANGCTRVDIQMQGEVCVDAWPIYRFPHVSWHKSHLSESDSAFAGAVYSGTAREFRSSSSLRNFLTKATISSAVKIFPESSCG